MPINVANKMLSQEVDGLTTQPTGNSSTQEQLLRSAAHCFKENGFAATSIDTVARSLNVTKGMIYHHFRSKTDLFFAVYRRGMDINFAAIRPYAQRPSPALIKLAQMGLSHCVTLMAEQAFQRVLAQGVTMHQTSATTAAQRETLDELISIRNAYEALFRQMIETMAVEENITLDNPSLASKSFLAVLNSTVFWYSPREKAPPQEEQQALAQQLVSYALRGLGTELPLKAIHEMDW